MKIGFTVNKCCLLGLAVLLTQAVSAQFLVDMIDTTEASEKGLWAVYRKTDHLQISGYFQPQFQVAQSKAPKTLAEATSQPIQITGLQYGAVVFASIMPTSPTKACRRRRWYSSSTAPKEVWRSATSLAGIMKISGSFFLLQQGCSRALLAMNLTLAQATVKARNAEECLKY